MKWSGLKIIIPVFMLIPVIWHNFFNIKPINVNTDFKERTAWFDYLLPIGRTQQTGFGFVLLAEPVYFDLHIPMRLQNSRMVFKFNSGADKARIGVQTAPGWHYYFPPQITNGNEITVLSELFSYTPNYRQRYIISVPDLNSGSVEIASVQVVMTRAEFNWQWLYDKTINRYKLWISKFLAPLARNTRPFTQTE